MTKSLICMVILSATTSAQEFDASTELELDPSLIEDPLFAPDYQVYEDEDLWTDFYFHRQTEEPFLIDLERAKKPSTVQELKDRFRFDQSIDF